MLLVTCANVANLLMVRAAERASDVAIRIALGAAHGRLIRQALMESVMLALPGGAIGFVAGLGTSGVHGRQLLGTSGPVAPGLSPDVRVILFAVGLSLATAVLFGAMPALRIIACPAVQVVSKAPWVKLGPITPDHCDRNFHSHTAV